MSAETVKHFVDRRVERERAVIEEAVRILTWPLAGEEVMAWPWMGLDYRDSELE